MARGAILVSCCRFTRGVRRYVSCVLGEFPVLSTCRPTLHP
jgi:hypothetical protein